jgi:nucleotide-binding universal stress UspA family protein
MATNDPSTMVPCYPIARAPGYDVAALAAFVSLCTEAPRYRCSRKFAPNSSGWHHADAGQASSEEEQEQMSIFPTRILLATDGSREAELAAETAFDLSKKLDSELHAVYVEPMPERHTSGLMRFGVDLPAEVVESVEQEARTKLEEQVQKIREAGGEVVQAHPRAGLPTAEIVALAEELGVGLIVIGSRGHGGVFTGVPRREFLRTSHVRGSRK